MHLKSLSEGNGNALKRYVLLFTALFYIMTDFQFQLTRFLQCSIYGVSFVLCPLQFYILVAPNPTSCGCVCRITYLPLLHFRISRKNSLTSSEFIENLRGETHYPQGNSATNSTSLPTALNLVYRTYFFDKNQTTNKLDPKFPQLCGYAAGALVSVTDQNQRSLS